MIFDREIAALVERYGVGSQLTGGLLLVDDEPQNLQVLRGFLDDEVRWIVHEANSGPEALAIAATQGLDVVITDQRMPGMTGVELLEEFKRRKIDAAGIVLTGYADMQVLEAAINRANAFRFLRKPWEPSDILQAVEQASAHVSQRRIIERLVRLLAERSEKLRASFDEQRRQQQMMLHLERLGTVGKLTSGVTHDLRNMMTSLREAEWELSQSSASTELREVMTMGMAHVERVLSTLKTLHDFTSTGALTLDRTTVDPADVVSDAIGVSRMDLAFRLRKVSIEVSPGLPRLVADRNKLAQALVNLIRNSLQATPKGAEVRISARPLPDGQVEFAVEDQGPGIPPDIRDRLFQPFESSKGAQGLGMGLYLARVIAESHGGTIRAVDRPGGGARFEVVVPQSMPPAAT